MTTGADSVFGIIDARSDNVVGGADNIDDAEAKDNTEIADCYNDLASRGILDSPKCLKNDKREIATLEHTTQNDSRRADCVHYENGEDFPNCTKNVDFENNTNGAHDADDENDAGSMKEENGTENANFS